MIHNKDHDFFTTPNLTNSYWAGFIAADGNVGKNSNSLTISLAAKDKEHLRKLSNLLAPEYVMREWARDVEGDKYEYVSLSLSSKRWKESLRENWLITPAKTHTLSFPTGLSAENTKAFLCGYIDGDGCIYIDKSRKNRIQLSICGTYDLLNQAKAFIEKETGTRFTGEQIYSTKSIYTFMASGSTAVKMIDYLYDDRLPLLDRKWDRYLEFRKTHKPRTYQMWSEEDNKILTDNHSKMSVRQLQESFFPERTYTSIEKRCNYLGLKKQYEVKWTAAEDLLFSEIRKNTKMKIREIHEKHFPYRTYSSVKNRARRHRPSSKTP